MTRPAEPPYDPPPYAAQGLPPASPPVRGGAPVIVAAVCAGAVILTVFAELFVQAAVIASGDFSTLGLASLPVRLMATLLGIGAIVAGAIAVSRRVRVVLAGVAIGVGIVPVLSAVLSIVQFAGRAAMAVL
ncbi:hypothetical protein [Microbacterium sp. JZ31]|uniref:hypothetical protein n=1 Tax=Microbacterium sp. JZ31 TaxID=1906274 RepID=UPI001934997A|nr:hypothetical protein [Microbacterium sp. JZ31]